MNHDKTSRDIDSEEPQTLRTIVEAVSEKKSLKTSPPPTLVDEAEKSLGTIVESQTGGKTHDCDPATINNSDHSLRTLADHKDQPASEDGSPRTLRDSDRSLNTVFDSNAPRKESKSNVSGASARFRILRPHAQGGLGKVSVALDQELNREVALKEILSQFSDDGDARERFIQEAEITGGLEHPGIVPVYSLGQGNDGQPYYAMRFIKGESLKKLIDDFHQPDNPNRKDPGERQFALRKLLDKFIDVCNAIEYAHNRGVLHRDLKPANIMVGRYGETLVVDWGLAKAIGQREIGAESPLQPVSHLSGSVQTMQGSAMGTPAYMSPEQAAGKLDELGPATDIYSLGATLYHILCGRPSFERENIKEILRKVRVGEFLAPREILPEIPPGLEAICLKGMALRPGDRYASARAMADDVEHWLADEPISASQDTISTRVGRWARKHKGIVQAGSVSLAMIALISTLAYVTVSVSNSRLKVANSTISTQNTEIKQKNQDLETANSEIKIARDHATSLVHEASRSDFATAQARLVDGKWREAVAYLGRGLRYDSDHANARDALWMTLRYGQRDCGDLPRILLRHDSAVVSASFNRDGSRLITASRDQTVRIWETGTGKQIGAALKHQAAVKSAHFSSDENRVLTISDEKNVQIWDVAQGNAVELPGMESDQVSTAIFSPDGTRILTTSGDGTAQIWDVESVQPIGPPLRHRDSIFSAEFSSDGKRVIMASGDSTAQVWDANISQPVGPPLRHQGAVFSAHFSPDGTLVLTTSSDTTARVWDASTGQPIYSPWNHDRSITTGDFSPDGTRAITASDDKTAKIWDIETGLQIGRPLVHLAAVTSALFSPDGTRIVTVCEDQTVRIWNAQSGRSIGHPITHAQAINTACFSPDGATILTASDDATAGVWNVQTGQPAGLELRHLDAVYDAIFSFDGQYAVTASGDTTAQIWDTWTGERIGAQLKHGRSITNVVCSPDGTRIVTCSDDSTARIWDAKTGQPIGNPLGHAGVVVTACFSPDGKRIVTGSHDTTARIWNVETGEPLGAMIKHDNFVTDACFSSNGELIVTASRDGSARIWNGRTGEPMGNPLIHDDAVYSACFSPDDKSVLTASRDKTARIWNLQTGSNAVGVTLQHSDSVYIARFHPAGGQVLTVSEERTVRLWDAVQGEEMGMPLVHESRINSACFSPGGSRILTANEDRTARIWDTATSQPLGPALMHEGSLNQASFSSDGTQIITASDSKSARIWDIRSLESLDGQIAELLTIVSAGVQLGRSRGTLESVTAEQRLSFVPKLQASLSQDVDWGLLTQLELDPQPESRISPRSGITRRQAVTRLIRSRIPEQIREAHVLDPGHPLIQIGLAGLTEYAKQAEFLREYGVSHLHQNIGFCHQAAEMLTEQGDDIRSIRALEIADSMESNQSETIRLLEQNVNRLESSGETFEGNRWVRFAENRLADHYEAIGEGGKATRLRHMAPADATIPSNPAR